MSLALAHIDPDAPGGIPVARPAQVHLLLPVGGVLLLNDALPVRLPRLVLAVQKMASGRPEAVELVLVGHGRNAIDMATARIDLRLGRYALREMTAEECLTTLLHHDDEFVMRVGADIHHVPLWIVTEGTPLVGRIGFDGTEAVRQILAPLGFDMEAH